MQDPITVLSAVRTPVGRVPGALNFLSETDLLALVMRAAVARAQVIPDQAIVGSAFPIERDNLCRKALLAAGLPPSISCSTVSKTCASSDEALVSAADRIACGRTDCVLVAGVEKLSNSPYVLHFMKQNIRLAVTGRLPSYAEVVGNIQENDMAYLSEAIAQEQKISRSAQDAFTLASFQKAQRARREGLFRAELLPVQYEKEGRTYALKEDELLLTPRTQKEVEQARPVFLSDGTLTQYNAAPMCECAAALVLCTNRLRKKGIARLEAVCTYGAHKEQRGLTQAACVKKLLQEQGMAAGDIDSYEINESFAVQAIATQSALGLPDAKINHSGGNLALGYPIGATGLRMCVTLVHQLSRRRGKGISVMCAGANMASAALFSSEGG